MSDPMRAADRATLSREPPRRPPPAAREPWLDVARGVTILLVVLLHADLMLEEVGERSMPVHLLALSLYPLRMPLFFLVSGILAAGMLARPAGRVLRDRVLHYLWVWGLWTALGYGLVNAWAIPATGLENIGHMFDPRTDPLVHLRTSSNWAWFLYALALFFGLALLLRRLPAGLHMAIAVMLAIPGLFDWGDTRELRVLDRFYFYPYFVAGWLGAARIRGIVPRLGRWPLVAGLCLAWAGATVIAHEAGWLDGKPGRLVLSFLAVPAALSGAALLAARLPALARPFARLGTRTLAIYLLHPWVLLLLLQLDRPGPLPVAAWCGLAVAVGAGLPVLLHPLLERVPGLTRLPWRPAGRRDGALPAAAATASRS